MKKLFILAILLYNILGEAKYHSFSIAESGPEAIKRRNSHLVWRRKVLEGQNEDDNSHISSHKRDEEYERSRSHSKYNDDIDTDDRSIKFDYDLPRNHRINRANGGHERNRRLSRLEDAERPHSSNKMDEEMERLHRSRNYAAGERIYREKRLHTIKKGIDDRVVDEPKFRHGSSKSRISVVDSEKQGRFEVQESDCDGPHERFDSCFAGCAAITCDNPRDRMRPCYPFCEPGCVCADPYVRDDRSLKCVLVENCSMSLQGIPDATQDKE